MKKTKLTSIILKILFLATATIATLAILFVFELPPFNNYPGNQTNLNENQNNDDQTTIISADESDQGESKVSRSKSLDEMMERAASLEANGFPSLAVAQYQEVVKKDPSNPSPLYEIGKIYLRTNNYEKSENIFEDILIKNPNDQEARILLTRTLLALRRISEAKEIINKSSELNQETLYYQAIIEAYFGEHEKAKQLLAQAIEAGDNENLKKKIDNFLKAYDEYKFNTESPTVHLKVLLARSFIQCGEYEVAIPLLFEVSKEKIDYRDAWILMGYAYMQTNKYQDAIEALERAKKLDNQKAETLFYLGIAYYNVNQFEDARENLLSAKEFGFEPQILVDQKLAEIYLELQEYDASVASYEKVLALNDADINYYIRPIWIYLEKLQQPQNALILAEQAAAAHPKEAMAHNLMGWALIYNNQLDKAEAHLKLALALNNKLDAVFLNLGLLNERQNHPTEALAFYQKAHAIGNGNGVAAQAATRYNALLASTNKAKTESSSTKSIQANLLNQ